MVGKDAVQFDLFESVSHYRLRCLGRISIAPVWDADPVAEFSVLMQRIRMQPDASAQSAVAAEPDSKTQLVFFRNHGKEFPRVFFLIRMRDAKRSRRHFLSPNQRHQFRNIRLAQSAKLQSWSLDERRFHSGSLQCA